MEIWEDPHPPPLCNDIQQPTLREEARHHVTCFDVFQLTVYIQMFCSPYCSHSRKKSTLPNFRSIFGSQYMYQNYSNGQMLFFPYEGTLRSPKIDSAIGLADKDKDDMQKEPHLKLFLITRTWMATQMTTLMH